jgi:hypothetical protein
MGAPTPGSDGLQPHHAQEVEQFGVPGARRGGVDDEALVVARDVEGVAVEGDPADAGDVARASPRPT